jgi:hypothetical protein
LNTSRPHRSRDFRRRKWLLCLGILSIGMACALVWNAWNALVLHKGYPEAYLLGAPAGRFGDFTDQTLAAQLPNPYVDPTTPYPPFAYALFNLFSVSDQASLILLDFISLVALAFLLMRLLRPIIASEWSLAAQTFLFLLISYPILFCLDRGNIEIALAALIAWTLYFFVKRRDRFGTGLLCSAISLKVYPAYFLVLLLRRRKFLLALLCGLAAIVITLISCTLFFEVPLAVVWNSYRHNLDFFHDYSILGNASIEGAASPWNAYKIVVLGLQQAQLIPPINYAFDGPFITTSFAVYSIALGLLAIVCGLHAWFYEQRIMRGIIVLLLFLSISAPSGDDYRLIYVSMALVLLVIEPRLRPGDWTVLVLLALTVVPKKEILLTFIVAPENSVLAIPIQTLLNPTCILIAMSILLASTRQKPLRSLPATDQKWAQAKAVSFSSLRHLFL